MKFRRIVVIYLHIDNIPYLRGREVPICHSFISSRFRNMNERHIGNFVISADHKTFDKKRKEEVPDFF